MPEDADGGSKRTGVTGTIWRLEESTNTCTHIQSSVTTHLWPLTLISQAKQKLALLLSLSCCYIWNGVMCLQYAICNNYCSTVCHIDLVLRCFIKCCWNFTFILLYSQNIFKNSNSKLSSFYMLVLKFQTQKNPAVMYYSLCHIQSNEWILCIYTHIFWLLLFRHCFIITFLYIFSYVFFLF